MADRPTWAQAKAKESEDPDSEDYDRAAMKAREASEKLEEAAEDVKGDAPRNAGLRDVAERAKDYAEVCEAEADDPDA